jgi:hypothetical protein
MGLFRLCISLFVLVVLLSDFNSSFVNLCNVLSNEFKGSLFETVVGGSSFLKNLV